MKSTIATLLLAVSTAQALGNGQTTNNIRFTGLPGSYTYQRATSINDDGTCVMGNAEASGPLAPLTNEMHHIFRGPLNLKQFAVYQPGSASTKRDTLRPSPLERRGRLSHLDKHKHKRAHVHAQQEEKRDAGEWVTVTMDGQVVSWINEYGVAAASTPAPAAAAENTPAPAPVALQGSSPVASAVPADTSVPDTVSTSDDTSSWARVGYFDGSTGTAENIAFTANNKFSMGFGFTQGYVASDGQTPASGPQVLSGFISDNYEVIVSSGQACSSSDTTGGCAVVTPGSDAHHGFGGDRIVIMEYTMPESACGSSCANTVMGASSNTNMPAIWALGSDLTNIAQYGMGPGGACSGWTSGAGEFDIHEICPGADNNIGYASFHMGNVYSGTAPEGLVRPTDPNKTQMLAYILSGSSASIHVLPTDFNVGEGLSAADVQNILNDQTVPSAGNSFVQTAGVAYPASVDSTTFAAILG